MTQLSFKDQFKPLILSGEKRQTIRENKGKPHRIKGGDTIHFMNGGYKACVKREFAKATCFKVCEIKIERTYCQIIELVRSDYNDIKPIYYAANSMNGVTEKRELDKFAKNDGFQNYSEMWQWFVKTYKLDLVNGVFEGWLIMWGDLHETQV